MLPGGGAVKLRWIIISFFLIGGGITLAAAALIAAWVSSGTLDLALMARLSQAASSGHRIDPSTLPQLGTGAAAAAVLLFGAGAALGGFFAGRASPHRSYVEPAIAAALVVGSLWLLIHSTPMGKLAVSFVRSEVEAMASILAATGLLSGLIGAVLGELASGGPPRVAGPVRQTGIAVLITAGALLAAVTVAAVLLLNEAAEAALRAYGAGEAPPTLPAGRLAGFGIVAVTAASLAAGAVTQMAAPIRVMAPAATAAGLILLGVGLAISRLFPRLEWLPPASLGAGVAAALLAATAAALIWGARRALGGGSSPAH